MYTLEYTAPMSKETLDKTVTIRVTNQIADLLTQNATSNGMTRSEYGLYLLKAALGVAPVVEPSTTDTIVHNRVQELETRLGELETVLVKKSKP
jgi:uncharacterized protein (DUF1778 family)